MPNIERKNRKNIHTEKTDNDLNQLKKEMIERIFDKIKEKNKDDIFLYFGKDAVVDYLLDEGDDLNDFFLGIGINLLSKSADQLNDLRKKIKSKKTKEELENLEQTIIESLNDLGNNQDIISGSAGKTISQDNTKSSHQASSSDTISEMDSSVDSARIGEAKEIPLKQRMERLFPQGVPKYEKDMRKYIKTIKVPIITADGKKEKIKIIIHKKLANEYKAIFKEMYDKKIPVNPEQTGGGGFQWREVRGKEGTGIMSHHSYGSAIDINYLVNGGVYGKTDRNSPYYNSQAMVNIRKKHGFYRGGDWSKKSYDPMHFTYMNG